MPRWSSRPGRGTRAGRELPKQYAVIGGKTVLRRTLEALLSHEAIGDVLVVIGDGDAALYEDAVRGLPRLLPPVAGGAIAPAIGPQRPRSARLAGAGHRAGA